MFEKTVFSVTPDKLVKKSSNTRQPAKWYPGGGDTGSKSTTAPDELELEEELELDEELELEDELELDDVVLPNPGESLPGPHEVVKKYSTVLPWVRTAFPEWRGSLMH